MRPYASTAAVPGTANLWERLTEYLEAGITSIELGSGVTLETLDPDTLVARLETLGGHWLVHNYFPPQEPPFFLNLASADEETRRRSVSMVEDGLALTARLGGPFHSVHAGWVTDPVGMGTTSLILPEPSNAEAVAAAEDRFHRSLEYLLACAETYGVDLLLENNVCSQMLRGKVLLADAVGFSSLFSRLASDRLGLLLDFGHLRVSAATLGFEPLDFVDEFASAIRAFNVHDNDGSSDAHEPVSEGSWVLDVLRRPEHASAAVVAEAHFQNPTALARHLDLLATAIAGASAS